jgi:pilus assembly protein CpaE
MIIFLVSECATAVSRLRHLLSQSGHDCPVNHVASYETAPDAAATAQPRPNLIILVISGEAERALETLRQLRRVPGGHILAIGPRDSSMILGAVRAGAHDYLEEEGDLARGLSAALARISESVQRRSALGNVTTVLAASGGTGRTLVATNLAVSLARAHGRCGLFDFDLRGSDVATFLGLRPRHTIADLCRSIDKLDHKMWEQSMLEHETSVSVLAGPETWEDARHVTADAMQKILRFGRGVFPHIVADMDSFWPNDCASMLLECTTILLLFRLDFTSVRNAMRAVQHLDRVGVASGNLVLAVSRYGKHTDISPAQAEAALGMPIRHFVPEDSQIVNASVNCGAPVVVEAPRSPFAKALSSIVETLAQRQTSNRDSRQVEESASGAFVGTLRSFLKLSIRDCAMTPSLIVDGGP